MKNMTLLEVQKIFSYNFIDFSKQCDMVGYDVSRYPEEEATKGALISIRKMALYNKQIGMDSVDNSRIGGLAIAVLKKHYALTPEELRELTNY